MGTRVSKRQNQNHIRDCPNLSFFLTFNNDVFYVFYDHRVSSCSSSNRVSSVLLTSYPAKHAHFFPNERQRGGNGGKWHENAWNDKRNNQIVPGSRFYPRLPLWLVLWPVYTV